ncbi:hypothetical protein BBJ28_00009857 [Nothophytophthora sp. Chile5]|nr:hypothetical protein BBJ28_00009857 [Nothophytophthora sp. Chile5]
MQDDHAEEARKTWDGAELLAFAAIQLLLVNVAYRIDQQLHVPLVVQDVGLDPELLFFGLLPPIILEAGFNTQRKGFFNNLSAILLLAVVGTLVATFVTAGVLLWFGSRGYITPLTSAEAYLFGSLISATDPVATLLVFRKSKAPSLLFNLVFGESVLNDAVAIVTFTLFQRFVASGHTDVDLPVALQMLLQLMVIGLGSVVLAGVVCLTSAFFLQRADPASLHRHPTYEIAILLLSSYASYVAAELCGLSGLVAVFFSGVFLRHYHLYSISKASSFAFKHLLSTLAFLSENAIYVYIGLSLVAYRDAFLWDWRFIAAATGACLVARACNTFPLCSLANCGRRPMHRKKIPATYMAVIWFAGLRGAIAFALALNVRTNDPSHAAVIKGATIFLVIFTTVFLGMGSGPLLRALGLSGKTKGGFEHEDSLSVRHCEDEEPLLPMTSPASMDRPTRVHSAWVNLDETYLKPLFGGNPRSLSANGSQPQAPVLESAAA